SCRASPANSGEPVRSLSMGRSRNGENSAAALACASAEALELEMAMGFKTILVPVEQHALMNSTLETALLLARKFDSYMEGFALRVEIPVVFAVGDVGAVPIPAFEQDIAENEKRSRSLFENFMQEHGVPRGGDTKILSSGWLQDAPEGDRRQLWPGLRCGGLRQAGARSEGPADNNT